MAPDSPGGENIILDVCGVRAISIFDQSSEVADAVFLAAGTGEIVVPVKRDDVVEGASNFLWEFSQWLSWLVRRPEVLRAGAGNPCARIVDGSWYDTKRAVSRQILGKIRVFGEPARLPGQRFPLLDILAFLVRGEAKAKLAAILAEGRLPSIPEAFIT